MSLSPAALAFTGGVLLVALGLYALMTSHHLIKILVGMQIMGKGILLALIAAGQMSGQVDVAQALTITVIVADTIVTIAGLAFAVRVQRQFGTLDVRALASLKG
jgi:NADH:ubiquinone oxidoreductase subunit K